MRILSCLTLLLFLGCASEPEEISEADRLIAAQLAGVAYDEAQLNQHWADVHRTRGDMALLKGSLEVAEQEYQESLRRIPGHADATLGLSQVRLKQDRVEDARRLLNQLLQRHPDYLLGWHNLAALRLRHDKDIRGSLQAVEQMLRIDPLSTKARNFKQNLEARLAEAE